TKIAVDPVPSRIGGTHQQTCRNLARSQKTNGPLRHVTRGQGYLLHGRERGNPHGSLAAREDPVAYTPPGLSDRQIDQVLPHLGEDDEGMLVDEGERGFQEHVVRDAVRLGRQIQHQLVVRATRMSKYAIHQLSRTALVLAKELLVLVSGIPEPVAD